MPKTAKPANASETCAVQNRTVHLFAGTSYIYKNKESMKWDRTASTAARTYPVGVISAEDQKLIDVTRQSFFEGIKYAMEGFRIGDIGHAVQQYAESFGMGVIRDYTGHGTGSKLHGTRTSQTTANRARALRSRET